MTTTHSVNLSEHEVRAALRGELGLVVRPVSLRHVHDIEEDGTPMREGKDGIWREAKCPLGVPGDRVVCREGWHTDERDLEHAKAMHEDAMSSSPIFYQADPANRNSGCRWRSPATMPLWASRIMLEVVGVRCVRFGELSHADAKLCGLIDDGLGHFIPMQRFWNAKYAKRGLGWETNPFVWAGGVRRVEG